MSAPNVMLPDLPAPPAPWSVVEWKHANAGGTDLVLHAGLWEGPAAFGLRPGDPFFTVVTSPTPWGCGSWGPFPTSAIISTRDLRLADTWRYSGSEARWSLDDLLRALRDAGCSSNAVSLSVAIEAAREREAPRPVTILDLVAHALGRDPNIGTFSGDDFAKAGYPMFGGCQGCEASIAAYNAHPSKTGYLRCSDCIGDLGWNTVEEALAGIAEARS